MPVSQVEVRVQDLKAGLWVRRVDINGVTCDWRISRVEEIAPVEGYTFKLILIREDLEQRRRREENGNWWPGRATIWFMVHAHYGEVFYVVDEPADRQFDWEAG